MANWGNLYPHTKTRNITDDNGDTLKSILEGLEISSGMISDGEGSSDLIGEYVLFPTGFYIFFYPEIELSVQTQNSYNRKNVYFPFDVQKENYSVSMNIITGGEVGTDNVHNLYVRNKYNSYVQLSSFNKEPVGDNDKLKVSVIVIGRAV